MRMYDYVTTPQASGLWTLYAAECPSHANSNACTVMGEILLLMLFLGLSANDCGLDKSSTVGRSAGIIAVNIEPCQLLVH